MNINQSKGQFAAASASTPSLSPTIYSLSYITVEEDDTRMNIFLSLCCCQSWGRRTINSVLQSLFFIDIISIYLPLHVLHNLLPCESRASHSSSPHPYSILMYPRTVDLTKEFKSLLPRFHERYFYRVPFNLILFRRDHVTTTWNDWC